MKTIKRNLLFLKTTKILMLALITSLLIVSCKQAPKANSEEVKKKATESAIKMIYINFNYIQKNILLCSMRGDQKGINDLNQNTWIKDLAEALSNSYTENKMNEELRPVIDSTLNVGNITIENIRVDNSNNDLKKCECSADLNIGLVSYKIKYTAQYTEDGKLVVETQFK